MKTYSKRKFYPAIMALCAMIAVLVLSGCMKNSANQVSDKDVKKLKNMEYEVGVLESSEKAKKSTLTYYDSDFKKVGVQTIPCCCDSDNFTQGELYKNEFLSTTYRSPKSTQSTPIVSVDANSHKIKEYKFSKELDGEKWFTVSQDVLYATANSNGDTHLESYDMKSGEKKITTIKSGIVTDMNCDKKNIYGLGINLLDPKDNAPIYVIKKKSLKLVDTVDIGFPADSCSLLIHKNKLYIPLDRQDSKEKYASKLLIYNLKKKRKEEFINIRANTTNNILRHRNRLFIALASPADGRGKRMAIVDIKTKKIKYVKFKHHLSQVKIKGDKLYVLYNEYDNNTTLYRYKIRGDKFIKEKEKNVFSHSKGKDPYYVGTFFVR